MFYTGKIVQTHRVIQMKSLYSFLFVFTFSLMALSYPAMAAYEEFEYSEAEKAGLAFYHFAGQEPDFRKWIQEYEYYLTAKPSKKNEILYEDQIRLEQGYRQFNPETDYITFKTSVLVHVPKFEKRMDFLNEYQKIPVKIQLPRMLEIPGSQETYFPYYVGGMWFAIIPENFQDLYIIYLDEAEFYEFEQELDIGRSTTVKKVRAEFVMRVKGADTQAPFPIGETESWLVMGEIGNMQLRHKDRNFTLWEYEAPWYIPKSRQDLMNLFKQ